MKKRPSASSSDVVDADEMARVAAIPADPTRVQVQPGGAGTHPGGPGDLGRVGHACARSSGPAPARGEAACRRGAAAGDARPMGVNLNMGAHSEPLPPPPGITCTHNVTNQEVA